MGYEPKEYAAELEIYAKSLSSTYGQDNVKFIFAQPESSLVPGITAPKISPKNNSNFFAVAKEFERFSDRDGQACPVGPARF